MFAFLYIIPSLFEKTCCMFAEDVQSAVELFK